MTPLGQCCYVWPSLNFILSFAGQLAFHSMYDVWSFLLPFYIFPLSHHVHVSRLLSLILFLCISWGSSQSIWNFPFSLRPSFEFPVSIHGSGSTIPIFLSLIFLTTYLNAWCSPCCRPLSSSVHAFLAITTHHMK